MKTIRYPETNNYRRDAEFKETHEKIIALRQENPYITWQEIAVKLNKSMATVARHFRWHRENVGERL